MGAITSRSSSYNVRPWEIKSFDFYDITSVECYRIRIEHRDSEILRITATGSFLQELRDSTRFFFFKFNTNRLSYPFLRIGAKIKVDLNWRQVFNFFEFVLLKLSCSSKQNILSFFEGSFFKQVNFSLLWIFNDFMDSLTLGKFVRFVSGFCISRFNYVVNDDFGIFMNFDFMKGFFLNRTFYDIYLRDFNTCFASLPSRCFNLITYRKAFNRLRFRSYKSVLRGWSHSSLYFCNFLNKGRVRYNEVSFIIGGFLEFLIGKSFISEGLSVDNEFVSYHSIFISPFLFFYLCDIEWLKLRKDLLVILFGNLSLMSIVYLSEINFFSKDKLSFINFIDSSLVIASFELKSFYNKFCENLNFMTNCFFLNFLCFINKDILGLSFAINSVFEQDLSFINVYNFCNKLVGKLAAYGESRVLVSIFNLGQYH